MGYDHKVIESHFFLPRHYQQAAFVAIKRLFDLTEDQRVAHAESLPELLSGHPVGDWYWLCDLDLEGNITNLDLSYWRLRSSDKLFATIAPFVAAGSFLSVRGEEGEEWSWVFDGECVRRRRGAEDVHQEALFPEGSTLRLSLSQSSPSALVLPSSDGEQLEDLQGRASILLGAVADTHAFQQLLPLLSNADPSQVSLALLALKPQARLVPLDLVRRVLAWPIDEHYATIYSMQVYALHLLEARGDLAALELLFDELQQAAASERKSWQAQQPWLSYYRLEQILARLGQHVPLTWFTRWLEHPLPLVRHATLHALGTRTPLVVLLENLAVEWRLGQADNLRRRALQILLRYPKPVPWEPLIPYLADRDSYVRHLAAAVLRDQGQQVPLEALLPFLESEDSFLCGLIIEALLPYGAQIPIERIVDLFVRGKVLFATVGTQTEAYSEEAVCLEPLAPFLPMDRLCRLAREGHGSTRWSMIDLLGRLGRSAPVTLLQEILEDKDLRLQAVKALGRPQVPVPHAVLEDLLTDTQVQVRFLAAKGLAARKAEVPLSTWERLLHHPEGHLRMLAIETLGNFSQAAPVLLTALSDPLHENRERAVEVLAQHAEHVPIAGLEEALTANSAWRRAAALQLVERMGERVPVELLERALAFLERCVDSLAAFADTPLGLILFVEHAWLLPLRLALWRRQGAQAPTEALLDALSDISHPVEHEATFHLLSLHPQARAAIAPEAEYWLSADETALRSPSGRYLASWALIHTAQQLANQQEVHDDRWDFLFRALAWPFWVVRVEALRTIASFHQAPPPFVVERMLQLHAVPTSPSVRGAVREALRAM